MIEKSHFIGLMLFLSAFVYGGDIHSLISQCDKAVGVLNKNCIEIQANGSVDLAFPDVVATLAKENSLVEFQKAYAELLPDGEKPEFEIQNGEEANSYFYVNRDNQRSDVIEVTRTHDSDIMETVFYVKSKRFFGRFEAVIYVQAKRKDEKSVDYSTSVYAYPHSGASRFLLRRLPFVEHFFRKKTKSMIALTSDIFRQILGSEQQSHS